MKLGGLQNRRQQRRNLERLSTWKLLQFHSNEKQKKKREPKKRIKNMKKNFLQAIWPSALLFKLLRIFIKLRNCFHSFTHLNCRLKFNVYYLRCGAATDNGVVINRVDSRLKRNLNNAQWIVAAAIIWAQKLGKRRQPGSTRNSISFNSLDFYAQHPKRKKKTRICLRKHQQKYKKIRHSNNFQPEQNTILIKSHHRVREWNQNENKFSIIFILNVCSKIQIWTAPGLTHTRGFFAGAIRWAIDLLF